MDAIIRIAVVYIAVLVGLRIVGKREFGQLSPVELVTLMLIPEIVSPAINRQDASIIQGIVGLSTVLALVWLTSALVQRSQRFETLVQGTPAVLVAHGQVFPELLNRERVTPGELLAEVHKAGLDDLAGVRWAILEGDGHITIVPEQASDRSRLPMTDQDSPTG